MSRLVSQSPRGPYLGLAMALSLVVLGACAGATQNQAPAPSLPRGVLAGFYVDPRGHQQPSAWLDGRFQDLSSYLPEGSQGGVVTELGYAWGKPVYSGSFVSSAGETRLFVLKGGQLTDLGPAPVVLAADDPRARPSEVALQGSADKGAGYTEASSGLRSPCYWLRGERMDLPVDKLAGARGGEARALATRGKAFVAAGFYYDGEYAQKPCLWTAGGVLDLSPTLPPGSMGGLVNSVALR